MTSLYIVRFGDNGIWLILERKKLFHFLLQNSVNSDLELNSFEMLKPIFD